jgi:hypothetical protein
VEVLAAQEAPATADSFVAFGRPAPPSPPPDVEAAVEAAATAQAVVVVAAAAAAVAQEAQAAPAAADSFAAFGGPRGGASAAASDAEACEFEQYILKNEFSYVTGWGMAEARTREIMRGVTG